MKAEDVPDAWVQAACDALGFSVQVGGKSLRVALAAVAAYREAGR